MEEKIELLEEKLKVADLEKKLLEKDLSHKDEIIDIYKEHGNKPSSITNNNLDNCFNKNLTVNLYLNEHCKNAMNLEDFVRNITVSLQDLDYSKQNGYAKGITNIFLKQLADLEPTERPIHCSDKKRLQFYVKDDNKWEKDKDNTKLTSSIKSVGMEQVKKMAQWEKEHPNYMKNPDELEEWQKILENVSGGVNKNEIIKNQTKIKKELCKVVDIKDELKT